MLIESWLAAAAVSPVFAELSPELLQAAIINAHATGKTNCLFILKEFERKGRLIMKSIMQSRLSYSNAQRSM